MDERQCWMCENYDEFPSDESGLCEAIADSVLTDHGVSCSVQVSATCDANKCPFFEMTDAARREIEDDKRYEMTAKNLQLTPGFDFPGTL